MKGKDTVKGNVKVFCETIDFDSFPDKDFISNFIKDNPFDLKKSIIAHCRTLDKYDVYQWVADDEVKIKNLLEENQQLKEKLESSEKARLKCLNKIKTLGKFDGENFTRSFTLWSADFNELAKILDIDKGE